MFFKFHVEFSLDRKQDEVNPADYIASQMQAGQRAEELALAKRDTQLKRFQSLLTEINECFNQRVTEFNADERIGNVFTLAVKDKETSVGRIDREVMLTVTFDPEKFTAKFHSTGRVTFDHVLEVRMNGQTPYLVHGVGRKQRESYHSQNVGLLCDKALRTLA
jgi:hypothetical protein